MTPTRHPPVPGERSIREANWVRGRKRSVRKSERRPSSGPSGHLTLRERGEGKSGKLSSEALANASQPTFASERALACNSLKTLIW